jgi:putative membrane protein
MLSASILVATLVYAGIGILVFAVGFLIWDRLTPIDMWKEICVNQNNAIAILAGSVAIALAIIIGAAIHG